eukprot:8796147-Alexandrium_andersonii.AAC.1
MLAPQRAILQNQHEQSELHYVQSELAYVFNPHGHILCTALAESAVFVELQASDCLLYTSDAADDM